jgi:hypothetical protein
MSLRPPCPRCPSKSEAKYRPAVGSNGIYQLTAYPDCSTPYSGKFHAETIFVVGHGTEQEQIFRRRQSHEALAAARAGKLPLFQAPVSHFCQRAVEDLYGAPVRE